MAKLLKLRRGSTSGHSSFTGAEGEVTIDTTKDTAVVHDGSTAGGRPLAREDLNNVSSATIAGRLADDAITTAKIAAGALPTDVTVASANIVDGTVATGDIADNAVTLAKVENIATSRIIGRATSGTGDPETLTAAQVRTLINVEDGATADQTASEIASALNGQNVYTTGHIGRDNNDYFTFNNDANVDLIINGSTEFRFESDGDFHADGDVIAQSTSISSDRRLKDNIEVIPNALDKVQALSGVSFDWKKTGERSAGVIAQEVQEVLPEAVKEVTPVGGGDSHLTVNYHALTSILIESIKELKAEIKELKGGA